MRGNYSNSTGYGNIDNGGRGGDGSGGSGRRGGGGGGNNDNNNEDPMPNPGEGGGWLVLTTAILAFGASIFFKFFKPKPSVPSTVHKTSEQQVGSSSSSRQKQQQKGVEQTNSSRTKWAMSSEAPAESSQAASLIPISSIFAAAVLSQSGRLISQKTSDSLSYRGYPCPLAEGRAVNTRSVRSAGPKMGDWVVEAEENSLDLSALQNSLQMAHDLQMGRDPNSRQSQDQIVQYHEELYGLWDRLTHVHKLLQKSEQKRKDMSEELKMLTSKHDREAEHLKSLITSQEEENKKIRKRLSQIHKERDTLISVLNEAQSSLSVLQPNLSQVHVQIGELTNAVKSQKSSLKLLKGELCETKKEKDMVSKKIDDMMQDAADIQDLLEVIENARDLISRADIDSLGDRTLRIDTCIQALQTYMLKPSGKRKVSSVREIGNRVVISFEKMLVELKKAFVQTTESMKKLKKVQDRLTNMTEEEKYLKLEMEEKKHQITGLIADKAGIERSIYQFQHDLEEANGKLNSSQQNENANKDAIETLTKEKDALAKTLDCLEREVAEIESVLQIVEKTRDIIMKSDPSSTGREHVQILDNCVQVLQQHMMRPDTAYERVSRDTSVRLVKIFQGSLIETKMALLKTDECRAKFEETKSRLAVVGSDQERLKLTLENVKAHVEKLELERNGLSDRCEGLKKEVLEKAELLTNAKVTQKEMSEAIEKITVERDQLQSKLQSNEEELQSLKQSYESVQAERADAKNKLDEIEEEKTDLETQLSGLHHRIDQFQDETNRLQVESQTLRENLKHERTVREQLEQETEELSVSRSNIQQRFEQEISQLRLDLEKAKAEKEDIDAECKKLDETKQQLITAFEEESALLKQKINEMEMNAVQDAITERTHRSSPPAPPERIQEGCSEYPTALPSDRFIKNDGDAHSASRSMQSVLSPASPIAVPRDDIANADCQPRRLIEDWMDGAELGKPIYARDNASASVLSHTVSVKNDHNAPSVSPLQFSAPVIRRDQGRQRRSSWPQDMTMALNDHLFGAAQELVDLTSTSLELAEERDALLSELTEVRQAIAEARTQLEEREAEVSDLTEHFLQVYQIASDLAADNDEQVAELSQLRQQSEQLRVMLEDRDERIAFLEAEFAMANMAPPPSHSSSVVRYSVPEMSLPTPKTDPFLERPTTPGSAMSADFGRARTRMRSMGSMVFEPPEASGNTPHPSTPSVINALFAGSGGEEEQGANLHSRRFVSSSLSSQRAESFSPVPSSLSSVSDN